MFNFLKGKPVRVEVSESKDENYWKSRNAANSIFREVSKGNEGLSKAKDFLKDIEDDLKGTLIKDLMATVANRFDEIKELKEKVTKLTPEFEVKFDPEQDFDESNGDFDFVLRRWEGDWGSYQEVKSFKTREEATAYIEVIKKEEAIDAS